MEPPAESSAPGRADDVLQQLSNDLMSPYCPGRTIASCPSKAARQLEDEILVMAREGKTREEIETELVARYGSDIIGYAPQPIVLYGTLIMALLALMFLGFMGRRWVRRRTAAEGPSSESPSAPRADAVSTGAGAKPSRAELDALDDALDEEEGF